MRPLVPRHLLQWRHMRVCSTTCSDWHQRQHLSSASLWGKLIEDRRLPSQKTMMRRANWCLAFIYQAPYVKTSRQWIQKMYAFINELLGECMNGWIMCEYLNVWGSEWMIGLLREGVKNWVSERFSERRNEWASKSVGEWWNAWTIKLASECVKLWEWMRKWRRVWINEWRPKSISEWICE